MARGAPPPPSFPRLLAPSLPGAAQGGCGPQEAIPGEEIGRQPIVTAPWNSPIRTPWEAGLGPRCPGVGVAVRKQADLPLLPGPGFASHRPRPRAAGNSDREFQGAMLIGCRPSPRLGKRNSGPTDHREGPVERRRGEGDFSSAGHLEPKVTSNLTTVQPLGLAKQRASDGRDPKL